MDADPAAELFDRLHRGDPGAAGQLFALYAGRLTLLAERNLSRRVAAREDGEDVVQSAFRTFFRRSAEGEFRIDSSTQLWRLLARITLLKARARARRHTAAPRDVRAERPGADDHLYELAARGPGPADAAALADLVAALLRGRPPLFADVLEMRLEGRPVTEIARGLGVSRKTVYQVLGQFKQRLTAALSEGGE